MLSDYLKSFDSRIVGLIGSKVQIDAVAKEFRVYVAPQKSGNSDYLVDCQEPSWNENTKVFSGLAINSENISQRYSHY